jgi:hypothetical protein
MTWRFGKEHLSTESYRQNDTRMDVINIGYEDVRCVVSALHRVQSQVFAGMINTCLPGSSCSIAKCGLIIIFLTTRLEEL